VKATRCQGADFRGRRQHSQRANRPSRLRVLGACRHARVAPVITAAEHKSKFSRWPRCLFSKGFHEHRNRVTLSTAALGLHAPWAVEAVKLGTSRHRIDFKLRCHAKALHCSLCGAAGQRIYDRMQRK